ncbi:hypothetical protein Ahy_B02g058549 [Arachis hypogaea]|uniref:Uncharacterized protein n=1 Tax=Arachis hypogaea TaxID=3818 RepID=A0A445AEV3_ARAHY|nr:hypothetical protein Ahy_B02g058549 [Arachis hypogaea]
MLPGLAFIVFMALLTKKSIEFLIRFTRAGKAVSYGGLMGIHLGNMGKHLLRFHVMRCLEHLQVENIILGAATTCYVALHPQVKGVSEKYFSDSNLSKTTSHETDADLTKKLWDFSMNLIK